MKVLTQTQKLRDYLVKSEIPLETVIAMLQYFVNRPLKEWGNPELMRRVK